MCLLLPLLSPPQQTKNKMKSRFFLNVVIRESSSIFELFSGKDEALLVGGDSWREGEEEISL